MVGPIRKSVSRKNRVLSGQPRLFDFLNKNSNVSNNRKMNTENDSSPVIVPTKDKLSMSYGSTITENDECFCFILGHIVDNVNSIKPYILRTKVENVTNEINGLLNRYVNFKCYGFMNFGKIISAAVNMDKIKKAVSLAKERLKNVEKAIQWEDDDILYGLHGITKLNLALKDNIEKSTIYKILDEEKARKVDHTSKEPCDDFNDVFHGSKLNSDVINGSTSKENKSKNHSSCERKQARYKIQDPEVLRSVISKKEEEKVKLNTAISSIFSRIDELIPTIDKTSVSAIIITKICDLLKTIHEKMMIEDSLKQKDFPVFRTQSYTVHVDSEKKLVSVSGLKIIFPVDGYAMAMSREKPKHVVSMIIRKCVSPTIKEGAKIKTDFSPNNFIMRLGDEKLSDHERYKNGKDVIDKIIDYAHYSRSVQEYSLNDYKACMKQVRKALADHNRNDRISKKRKHDSTIINLEDEDSYNSTNQESKIGEASTSRMHDVVASISLSGGTHKYSNEFDDYASSTEVSDNSSDEDNEIRMNKRPRIHDSDESE